MTSPARFLHTYGADLRFRLKNPKHMAMLKRSCCFRMLRFLTPAVCLIFLGSLAYGAPDATRPTHEWAENPARSAAWDGIKKHRWAASNRRPSLAVHIAPRAVKKRQVPLASQRPATTVPLHRAERFHAAGTRPPMSILAEAPVIRINLLRPAQEQALAQLSLADINRYQFRRNRSDAPGLPVQSASEVAPGDATK